MKGFDSKRKLKKAQRKQRSISVNGQVEKVIMAASEVSTGSSRMCGVVDI